METDLTDIERLLLADLLHDLQNVDLHSASKTVFQHNRPKADEIE